MNENGTLTKNNLKRGQRGSAVESISQADFNNRMSKVQFITTNSFWFGQRTIYIYIYIYIYRERERERERQYEHPD